MRTHLAQNQFITNSTAIQPPAVEQPAVTSLTLPASGVTAEPFAAQLGATAAETAATDPGRAVAATLSHNKITQAVEIQSYAGSLEGQAERDQRLRKSTLLVAPPLGKTPSVGAIIDSIPMAMEAGTQARPARFIQPDERVLSHDKVGGGVACRSNRRRGSHMVPLAEAYQRGDRTENDALSDLGEGECSISGKAGHRESFKRCAGSETSMAVDHRHVGSVKVVDANLALHGDEASDSRSGRATLPSPDRQGAHGPLGGNSEGNELSKPGPQDHIHELEQLIGVAGKRRRRPLALPRFVPDEQAIEDAMHDPNAPRLLAGDPVWADAAPIFLQDVRSA